jgi:predicted PurR-regulated permease PerM
MDRSKIIRIILFILTLAMIVVGFWFYKFIFSYILVSFLIAYIILPIINYAETYQIPRVLSIVVVYIIIAILLVLISNLLIPQIVQQAVDLAQTVQKLLEQEESISLHSIGLTKLSEFLENLESQIPGLEIEEQIKTFLDKDRINDLINQIPLFFKSIVNILAFLVVIPVIVFFILKDERKFTRTIFSKIKNRYFEFSLHLFERIEQDFGKFFRALLLETFLVALMTIIGLLIIGIPNAIILGIIVGVANPIKYFGPFIGAVPTILVILLGPTPDVYVFYAAIVFVITQQIDGLILFPWLVGKSMKMHPLWVLLTVIAGGYAFGILGMLFAVPVVFLIKTIVEVSHKSLKEFEII